VSREYEFVIKHLISDTPGKKRRSINEKRVADDYLKGNVTQLIYRKYSKGRIHAIIYKKIFFRKKICFKN
jgi:hypothetical protein